MGGTGTGGNTPHKGKVQPDKGKVQPDKGKVQPDKGKSQALLGAVTDGAACVVLRASVETFGPAGDAELQFTVKWPDTTLAAMSDLTETNAGSQNGGDGLDSSGNLYLPATHPVPPNRS